MGSDSHYFFSSANHLCDQRSYVGAHPPRVHKKMGSEKIFSHSHSGSRKIGGRNFTLTPYFSDIFHSHHVINLVHHATDRRRVFQHDCLMHALEAEATDTFPVLGLKPNRRPDQRHFNLFLFSHYSYPTFAMISSTDLPRLLATD